jgi:hypothetical protein
MEALFGFAAGHIIIGQVAVLFAVLEESSDFALYVGAALFLAGPIFFGITYARYRNRGERHYHERETPVNMTNLQSYDNYVQRLTEQRSSKISGANSQQVNGSLVQSAPENYELPKLLRL